MTKEERTLRIKILMDASLQFAKGLDVLEKYADKFGRDGFIHSVQELIAGGTASLRGSIEALTHFVVVDGEDVPDPGVADDPARPLYMTGTATADLAGWTLPPRMQQRLRTFGLAQLNPRQPDPDPVLEEREQLTDPDNTTERF